MEEMVQVLFDEGALVRNGAVKLTRPMTQLKIPPPCRRFSPRGSTVCRPRRNCCRRWR